MFIFAFRWIIANKSVHETTNANECLIFIKIQIQNRGKLKYLS